MGPVPGQDIVSSLSVRKGSFENNPEKSVTGLQEAHCQKIWINSYFNLYWGQNTSMEPAPSLLFARTNTFYEGCKIEWKDRLSMRMETVTDNNHDFSPEVGVNIFVWIILKKK